MRKRFVWMMAQVVVITCFAVAVADEPKTGSHDMIREIYVPFEELDLLLQEQPERILLSRDEYETLLKAAQKTLGVHAPFATTTISADYVVTVGLGRAEFAGTLVLEISKPGLHAIELELGRVGVRRALLDGNSAPIARNSPDRMTVFVEGEGRHQLALDMTAPVETNAANQVLSFQLPLPPITHMSMTVPGNVEIRGGAAVISRVFDESASITRFEILPQREGDSVRTDEVHQISRLESGSKAGAVSLVMTLNNRFNQAQRSVAARGVIVDEITASYERLHATYSMNVLHQPVDRFRFLVPDGFEVTDVQSPLLSHWTVNLEGSPRILQVELREPANGNIVLGLSALKVPSHPTSWSLPRLEPLEVIGEAAVVGLLLEDRLSLRSLTTDKLIPIDTSVITDALPGMVFASDPGAPRLRAVAAYYAPAGSKGFDATGVFEQSAGQFLVTASMLLSLAEKALHAQVGFAIKPVTDRLFTVDIQVPSGWEIHGMTRADGKALASEVIEAAEGETHGRVKVTFPGGIAAGDQCGVFFQAIHTPPGWLGNWTTAPISFPVFAVQGAQRDDGAIIVQNSDEIVAHPEMIEGLTPLDDQDKAGYGLATAAGSRDALAFRYEGHPYQATFRAERIPPRLTAKTYSFLHLNANLLRAHYEIVFDIDRARTDTLFFSLPESAPADLTIHGLEGIAVKDYESALVGGRRHWTVHLAERQRDVVRLAVDLEQTLDSSKQKPVEFSMPVVRAEGVARQSGILAIEGSAELDVEATTHLRKIDVGELAGAVYQTRRGTSGGLGVFAYLGGDPAVSVQVSRSRRYGLPTAIVQRAEMMTQVAITGVSQNAARLLLRASAAFLEFELPLGADLWSVELDGKPMQPQRDDDRFLISLPADDRVLDLRIIYESPIERVGLRSDVALSPPRFFVHSEGTDANRVDVPTADLQWNVFLPAGFRLADYSGAAITRKIDAPEPALWSVARALWIATGGIHPFYGGLLPSLSRAREMSHRREKISFDSVKGTIGGYRDQGDLTLKSGFDANEESDATAGKKAPPQSAKPRAMHVREDKAVNWQSEGKFGLEALKPLAAPPPSTPTSAWALEGVRSLKIELEQSGNAVAFTALGNDSPLRLTLANERRFAALRWGLAFAALLVGLVLTSHSIRAKALYIAAVAVVSTLAPILAGSSELTYLMNPMFFAVSLLVPFYIAVRLVQWIAANIRKPIRFHSGPVTIAGLFALFLTTTSHAQSPSVRGTPDDPVVVRMAEPLKPITVPNDALVIPYDPAVAPGPDGTPKAGNQVLIPFNRFQALWKLAHPETFLKAEQAPVPYALAGGSFTASLPEDGDLVLEGHLDIVAFVDDFVSVPLSLVDTVLTHAELDGRPALLSTTAACGPPSRSGPPSDPPLVLQLKGKGVHRLELGLRVQVRREGGWRYTEGRIPSAPGTALTVLAPSGPTEIRLHGADDKNLFETTSARESIATPLGPEGAVKLRWRPRIREHVSESSLTAASDLLLDVREDGLRVMAMLRLSGGGERDSYRLTLPRDYFVQAISGPNVRGWTQATDQEGEVIVSLLQTSKESETITVVLQQRRNLLKGDSILLEAPAIGVIGAALQNGRLAIRRSALLDLSTTSTTGVTRIDTPPEVDRMVDLSQGSADSPLGMAVYQSYHYASLPYVVRLSVKSATSDWSVESQTIIRIAERQRTLESRLNIVPTGQSIHQVRITIPGDLNIEHVDAPGPFEWSVIDGDANAKTLTVYLAAGQKDRFPIVIRGTLGAKGMVEQMELPVVIVRGARVQSGEVVVQIDPAFELQVTHTGNCQEIPLDRTYGWLTPAQRTLARLALRIWGDDYSAMFRIAARQPDVTCTTITNVSVTESAIEETILLDFVVTKAGLREISFLLPAGMKDARISIPMLRTKLVEPVSSVSDSPVRVRLTLQDEIMGRIPVLIEHDRALGIDAFAAPLPVVETGRTDRQFLAFENAGRDEVTVESQVGFEALVHSQKEWTTLANVLGATLSQAYVATGDHPAMTLKTRERAKVETTGARIGLATTVLVADEGGACLVTQTYRIDNRTEPFLDVLLPDGVRLWSVQVAGEMTKPAWSASAPADRRVRIPLIKSAIGDLDFEVVLKYAGKLPPIGGARKVDFPLPRAVNIAVELSHVNLFLPENYRWFDFDGTMRQVEDVGDMAAGWVRYQTRLTERLGQTMESESPFARARASASLKEMESQLEEVRRAASGSIANRALQDELQSNQVVVSRAQAQQQQQQAKKTEEEASTNNRGKLAYSFQQQRVARSRNQVQNAPDNFAPAPISSLEDKKDRSFNANWVKSNKLDDGAPPGERLPAPIEERLQRDDSLAKQQQALRAQPFTPQLASEHAGRPMREQQESQKSGARTKRQRLAGADDLAQQYQQRLEQSDKMDVPVAGVPAEPEDGETVALAGLTFDFPLRGTTFHFMTPRGDATVTARSVSNNFLQWISRLGLALFAGLGLALIYRWSVRVDVVERMGRTGSIVLIVLGAVSLVSGVLPVLGALAMIGGFAVLRKPRRPLIVTAI